MTIKNLEKVNKAIEILTKMDIENDLLWKNLDPKRHDDNPWETTEEGRIRELNEIWDTATDELWDKFNIAPATVDQWVQERKEMIGS